MSPSIKIRVKPHSRTSEMNWENGEWVARVTALPENGKANRELLHLLADFFRIPIKDIRIKSGGRSAVKWIQVPEGIETKHTQGGNYG